MRMRKKKWADPFIESNPQFVIHDPQAYKGKWKEKFNKDILHVEIGTGKGDYFINMATMYPDEAWLGIEKDHSCGAVAAKKSIDANLANQLMIIDDASELTDWFDNKEIDVIHLNFSDPWPKKRNSKRRLSHNSFLKKYYDLLSDDGQIILKTDNAKFFEFSLVELTHNNFSLENVWVNFRQEEHPEDAITEYESKFISLNQPIYRAIFVKVIK